VLALFLLPACILAAATGNPVVTLLVAASLLLVLLWPVERGQAL
jgi:hypothetical protein